MGLRLEARIESNWPVVNLGEASSKKRSRVVNSVVLDNRLSQDEMMEFWSSRRCNSGRSGRGRGRPVVFHIRSTK